MNIFKSVVKRIQSNILSRLEYYQNELDFKIAVLHTLRKKKNIGLSEISENYSSSTISRIENNPLVAQKHIVLVNETIEKFGWKQADTAYFNDVVKSMIDILHFGGNPEVDVQATRVSTTQNKILYLFAGVMKSDFTKISEALEEIVDVVLIMQDEEFMSFYFIFNYFLYKYGDYKTIIDLGLKSSSKPNTLLELLVRFYFIAASIKDGNPIVYIETDLILNDFLRTKYFDYYDFMDRTLFKLNLLSGNFKHYAMLEVLGESLQDIEKKEFAIVIGNYDARGRSEEIFDKWNTDDEWYFLITKKLFLNHKYEKLLEVISGYDAASYNTNIIEYNNFLKGKLYMTVSEYRHAISSRLFDFNRITNRWMRQFVQEEIPANKYLEEPRPLV